ncbi:hypothetical protein, partial [Catenulispora pinisilvae]|uniref:hypothetical protein n=1 Tax=Catenulispora pinisilvae TaxID=2705253 RepID=UPI001E461303
FGTTPARTVPKGHKTFISRGTPHHEATTYTSAPIHVRDTLDLALDLAVILLLICSCSDLPELKRPEVRRGREHENRQPTNTPADPNPEPAQP